MSKADEMFLILGYKKYEVERRTKYIRNGLDTIIFDMYYKTVTTFIWNDGYQELAKVLNIEELQAINEKCKELGWIE